MIYELEPEFVKKPWGISQVQKHTHIIPPDDDKYGEIWIASSFKSVLHENQDGAKSNRIKGTVITLSELIEMEGIDFLGEHHIVSPMGKTESWYFREVKGRVRIVTGLKNISKEKYKKLVKEKYFEKPIDQMDILKIQDVQTGDAFLLNPGTVHTIVPDIDSYAIIDEVQQGFGYNNLPIMSKILMVSDLLSLQVHPSDDDVKNVTNPLLKQQFLAEPTLRISDFGRGRSSHPHDAADYINYDQETCKKIIPTKNKLKNHTINHYFHTPYFSKDIIKISGNCIIDHDKYKKTFYIYQVIEGQITVDNKTLFPGSVFAIGADTSKLEINSQKATLIRDFL